MEIWGQTCLRVLLGAFSSFIIPLCSALTQYFEIWNMVVFWFFIHSVICNVFIGEWAVSIFFKYKPIKGSTVRKGKEKYTCWFLSLCRSELGRMVSETADVVAKRSVYWFDKRDHRADKALWEHHTPNGHNIGKHAGKEPNQGPKSPRAPGIW